MWLDYFNCTRRLVEFQTSSYERSMGSEIDYYCQDESKRGTHTKKLISEKLDIAQSEMKDGIDTYLGKINESSQDLSGGQWQKIALARLLYSSAPINILDEPTAALDPIAESRVYNLFDKINYKRFTIYITHRLGAARIADEILVVDDGHIIEQGSHERLMSYGKQKKKYPNAI